MVRGRPVAVTVHGTETAMAAAMRSPIAWARGVRHPEAFHGRGVTRRFFEGWYVKLVSADRAQRWAVIPGIFRGLAGDTDEAFVQVLDGVIGRSWYHRFALSDFAASDRGFDVRVGPNRFTSHGATLKLPQLRGDIAYTTPLDPWPVTLREPGIMGWYGHIPFMECFHGIVSFGHGLAGAVDVEGMPVRFDGGRGYIEKDWGRAFPAGYVWLASNHLDADPTASLVASTAIIPWMRGSFRGAIIGLRRGGRLDRWTTYNGSRTTLLQVEDAVIRWHSTGPAGTLEMEAQRARGGLLHAPLRTAMHQRVEETLDARVQVRHTGRDGRILLDATADCAGVEVFGDIGRLLSLPAR